MIDPMDGVVLHLEMLMQYISALDSGPNERRMLVNRIAVYLHTGCVPALTDELGKDAIDGGHAGIDPA
jgi:hypothetical protein